MRHDPLIALRRALLLALGAGACTAVEPPPSDAPEQAPTPAPKPAPARGLVHRAGPTTCDPANPRPACGAPDRPHNTCKTDADCTDGAYPKCIQRVGQVGEFCTCDYACRTDADCPATHACVCGEALPDVDHATCVQALCRTDADCPSGTCGLSVHNNGCQVKHQLACRGPGDACTTDADCAPDRRCAFDDARARWDCVGITCVIGRPLTIDGAARTAPAVARGDWLADLDLPRDVPEELAAALAAHWSEVAALEHASVASFARFTLELMALGAPPELLAGAQRAALDEIEHARLAWSLASLWSGRDLGPGPLSLAGLPAGQDLSDMVHALVREGCVGETLGAAEAEALADASGHPTMDPLLRSIALDEARHAALAWRTLRWLLERHGAPVRVAALVAVAEARAALLADVEDDPDAPRAPTWGLLPRAELIARRREAMARVVEPVLRAILGPGAAA